MRRALGIIFLCSMLVFAACGTPTKPSPSPAPKATPRIVATITVAPTALPPGSGQSIVYIIKLGDTLSEIAERYNTTVEAIQKANNIKDPHLIVVGQELIIPQGGR